MTQLANGRWVPAQPLPFMKDTRPWYVRLGHIFLEVFFNMDEDELMDTWWVPVEPGDPLNPEPFPRG